MLNKEKKGRNGTDKTKDKKQDRAAKPVRDARKFKYGTNATILTVGVIVAVVILNFVFVTLNEKIALTIDFSKAKLYDLSQQTEETLKGLEQDVKVKFYSPKEIEQSELGEIVVKLLEKYERKSDKITVEYVDMVKNPTATQRFKDDGVTVSQQDIVFEMGDKYKIVKSSELFSSSGQNALGVLVEQKFTNALIYLKTDKVPVVYMTTGHQEVEMTLATQQLQADNYEVKTVDLMTEDVPVGDTTVIINSPAMDFDAAEIDKLDAYLDKGGNVQVYFDSMQGATSLPRLESYLSDEWGITRNAVLAVEGSQNKLVMIQGLGALCMADIVSGHDATNELANSNARIAIPISNTLTLDTDVDPSIKHTTLLELSDTAYAKNLDAETIEKADGDPEGPFDIVVAATRDVTTDSNETVTGKLIVSGTSVGFDTLLQLSSSFANGDLLQNMNGWMLETKELVSIRPKYLTNDTVTIPAGHVKVWYIVLIAVLPLAILISGLVIWRRRRYR